jgi:Leucine-rich repeat (LRR) protein
VPDFTNNTGLTEITLGGNNFTTGTFANFDFSKLTALTRFDVSDNPRLSKLPPSLSACTLLESLFAYKCALNQADSFPDMRNTKVSAIYAYNNGITTLPNAFCQLSNWVKTSGTNFSLYLSENPLGNLPSCFSSYQIDNIELSETSFTSFPSVLFNSYIRELNWESNDRRLTLSTGAVDLSKWRESLVSLTLENTQIEGPFLNGLAGSQFYGLSASGNHFTGTIADNFFSGGRMEYFRVAGSTLSGPFPASVGLSTNLDGIHAAGNKFTSVPDSIANLYKLQELDFSDNDLRSIPMSNSVWESMSLLRVLSIGGNHGLTGSIPTSWVSGTELYNVNASYCSFRGDHPAINSTILYKLFLSGNFLDGTIKEPIKAGYLRDWHFDQNSLHGSIPASVGKNSADLDWSSLRSFNASYNRLTGPLPISFRESNSLRNIEQLHINNNGLSGALPNFENLYNVESFIAHTNFFNICLANPSFSEGHVSPDECSVVNNPYFGGCYCPEYFHTFCQADYTCPPPDFVQVPLGEAPTPVLPRVVGGGLK